jgi:hypothetical protein
MIFCFLYATRKKQEMPAKPESRRRMPKKGEAMTGKASICRRLGLLGPDT